MKLLNSGKALAPAEPDVALVLLVKYYILLNSGQALAPAEPDVALASLVIISY